MLLPGQQRVQCLNEHVRRAALGYAQESLLPACSSCRLTATGAVTSTSPLFRLIGILLAWGNRAVGSQAVEMHEQRRGMDEVQRGGGKIRG